MKRIKQVEISLPYGTGTESDIETIIKKIYYEGESEAIVCKVIDNLEIRTEGTVQERKVIKKITLPEEFEDSSIVKFENCVFIEPMDLNLHRCNIPIRFYNCIFLSNITLFGDFDKYVSFEQSTFIKSKVDFQECRFEHFVLNLATFIDSTVSFQETTFYSNNIPLGNLYLNNSRLLFNNSYFAKDADLLDLIAIEADDGSKIIFSMVDFRFVEVRLFHSKIKWLEFRECTFECNQFDFDFECDTLIIQNCANFKIINLFGLKNLYNLNIYNFTNIGKVLINQEPDFFAVPIQSDKEILWVSGSTYKAPTQEEYKNQFFTLKDFYDGNRQVKYIRFMDEKITRLEKLQEIDLNPLLRITIFISYSWKDKELANNVDAKFSKKNVNLVRDIRDIEYRDSIKDFMKKIRSTDYVILIISDNQLKSANCLYELNELIKDENYLNRVLPILKSDADIFTAIGRAKYLKYWEERAEEIITVMKTIKPSNQVDLGIELNKIERIQPVLLEFLQTIADKYIDVVHNNSMTEEIFEKLWVVISENSNNSI